MSKFVCSFSRKGNPWVDFLMVIMASGIACGRIRTTVTTTESRNMVAILQIIGWQCSLGLPCTSLILNIHVMINWHLSKQGIRWPVSSDHIAGSSLQLVEVTCFFWSWPLTKCWFSIGLRAHVRLTCWKQGSIFQKPVNANPGFKVNWIKLFLLYKCFLLLCFVYMVIIKTQNRRPSNIQKTSPQSYKTRIKILLFPGLA